jgi:hypothetical protein
LLVHVCIIENIRNLYDEYHTFTCIQKAKQYVLFVIYLEIDVGRIFVINTLRSNQILHRVTLGVTFSNDQSATSLHYLEVLKSEHMLRTIAELVNIFQCPAFNLTDQ